MQRTVPLFVGFLSLIALAARAQDCPTCAAPTGGIFQPLEECCPDCRGTRIYRSQILGRLWVRADFLAWAIKPQQTPPLVTTGPAGALPEDTGVLGEDGTRILFGDERLSGGVRSGGRITGGFWWTPEQLGGIEASYFELDGPRIAQRFSGRDDLPLARPYLDVVTGQPVSALVAYPGVLDGSVDVGLRTAFQGAEGLLRHALVCEPSRRVDLLAGYRYLRLADRLEIDQSQTALDASSGFSPGTLIDRRDLFQTVNNFHGGEVGLVARWWRKYLALEVQGKLALGGTQSATTIDGLTLIETAAGGSPVLVAQPGGVLALPTNMGVDRHGRFAAMSELEIALELALTCELRLKVGYDLLYWSDVARAPDQIDRRINPSQIPPGALLGVSRPEHTLRTTDFWAQGLTLGVVYQF